MQYLTQFVGLMIHRFSSFSWLVLVRCKLFSKLPDSGPDIYTAKIGIQVLTQARSVVVVVVCEAGFSLFV